MEKTWNKIVQARYNLYLTMWAIGDDAIKEHNKNLQPGQAEWASVSEYYDYYLKAWCKSFNLRTK